MVEPELGGEGKRLSATQPLDHRQKDLFFHPDVAKEAGAKLSVRSLLDKPGTGRCLLQQSIEPPVVIRQKSRKGSCDSVLSLTHLPIPIKPCSRRHSIHLPIRHEHLLDRTGHRV
jgi:hypothetical protein